MKRHLLTGATLALAMVAGAGDAQAMDCSDLLPSPAEKPVDRDLETEDLVRLRDMGTAWIHDPALQILSVSPDGTKVAFPLRRAKVAENDYCLGVVVMDARAGAIPKLVNVGGKHLRIRQSLLGITNYPSGYAEVITPKWSPDGKYIAFLRQDEGPVQVWWADVEAGTSRAATAVDFDVETFEWSADGRAIQFAGRPALGKAMAEIEQEGRSGYLFDERYIPFASNRPFPLDTIPKETFSLDLASGRITPVQSDRTADPVGAPGKSRMLLTPDPGGREAWLVPTDAANVASPARLVASMSGGGAVDCLHEACLRAKAVWWTAQGEIVFQRTEGWGRSLTAVYVWSPIGGGVRRLLQTPDVLVGCQVAGKQFICGREGNLRPRAIVSIDLTTGQETLIFNPNPEFRYIRLGKAERLHWKNVAGIETFGDLVLPPSHQPGQRHPLVIVQYLSRGFLRGGTGDDFPILMFAQNGFAVLRFEVPFSSAYYKGAKDWPQLIANERVNWQHRREIQSSLEEGIELMVSKGVVDRDRVGLTGFSDGGQTVRFALINSDIVKVASVSSCCEDQSSIMSLSGLSGAAEMQSYGYPALTEDRPDFWEATSTRRNAAKLTTPVLMQLRDREYLGGLESFMALKEQKQPVEMYVFPNEFHEIWQPAHRFAIYSRNIDWFRFWLKDEADSDPAKVAQYKRWRAMKDAQRNGTGATPGQ